MKALIVGSFDPITFGHLDMILKAANMFDKLVIGVGNNINKKYQINIPQ
jgi:pantetheine-phosphate adenylyltransferase